MQQTDRACALHNMQVPLLWWIDQSNNNVSFLTVRRNGELEVVNDGEFPSMNFAASKYYCFFIRADFYNGLP